MRASSKSTAVGPRSQIGLAFENGSRERAKSVVSEHRERSRQEVEHHP